MIVMMSLVISSSDTLVNMKTHWCVFFVRFIVLNFFSFSFFRFFSFFLHIYERVQTCLLITSAAFYFVISNFYCHPHLNTCHVQIASLYLLCYIRALYTIHHFIS